MDFDSLSTDRESELFRLIAVGDESAFRDVFELYTVKLVSYVHAFTKSEEEAKEITQDLFLKLWINREKLADIESPRNYLFTMARHRALDFLRKLSVDNRMREHVWNTMADDQRRDDDGAAARERSRQVEEAMMKLSRQRQAVFHLSRVEGLSYEQIASHLSISKNTVKNHIVASIKFIRAYVSSNP